MRIALFLLLAAACGGEIATVGDGGTTGSDGSPTVPKADGSTSPPVVDATTPVVCGDHANSGFSGPSGCGEQEVYACGSDKYEVDCSCPAATCDCKKNGVTISTVKFLVCPSCGAINTPPSLMCGFPQ